MLARSLLTAGKLFSSRASTASARPVTVMVRSYSTDEIEREQMEYDVVIVGAGPAGLSTAIRLKQLSQETGKELEVCVLEKGAEVGAHILSGNVFEPRALNELIPDWKEKGAPLDTPVTDDKMMLLTEGGGSVPLPNIPTLNNHGNYIISLGQLCRWMAEQAEEMGVDIIPGFSGSGLLFNEDGGVKGVVTRDLGIGKDGKPKDSFEPGAELIAKQTVLAEGCRGSLSQEAMAKFDLRANCAAPTYGIGIKEVWQVDESVHKPGTAIHTLGYPLQSPKAGWDTYGGTFLYHMKPNIVMTGMVVGLDYKNPYLSPYDEFQRWKHHPAVRDIFAHPKSKCLQYGARALNEGGFQAVPKLTFPGGALIGCAAGFLNVPKIKGSHTAMKSGMLAAEEIHKALTENEGADNSIEATGYQTAYENSWVHEELKAVRNYHPSFEKGLFAGLAYSGMSAFFLGGKEPWTFSNHKTDSEKTLPASECKPIDYPKPDGKISFDILTNLARSGTNHEGDQPVHLRVKEGMEDVPSEVSYKVYGAPETRFCPAKVYEYTTDEDGSNPKLVINAQNCVHCKTCDIKMPKEYIKWTVPEGAGGPAYESM